jgi:hypothetical protein
MSIETTNEAKVPQIYAIDRSAGGRLVRSEGGGNGIMSANKKAKRK